MAYDWRERFGLSIDQAGVTVGWRESVALTRELLNDTSTRISAVTGAWGFPQSRESLHLQLLTEAVLGFLAGKRTALGWPWDNAPEEPVDRDVLEDMRDRLRHLSAFADVRDEPVA